MIFFKKLQEKKINKDNMEKDFMLDQACIRANLKNTIYTSICDISQATDHFWNCLGKIQYIDNRMHYIAPVAQRT